MFWQNLNGHFRKVCVCEFKLLKRGLDKYIVVHKMNSWLLHLLIGDVPLFLPSSCSPAPSCTKLCILLCPHFFWSLVLPTVFLTSQSQTNLSGSVLLFLWFQKIFLHLFTFPPRSPSSIYFYQGHFWHDDLLWLTCKPPLFSAAACSAQPFRATKSAVGQSKTGRILYAGKKPTHHPAFRFLLFRYAASNSIFYLLKSHSFYTEKAQLQ